MTPTLFSIQKSTHTPSWLTIQDGQLLWIPNFLSLEQADNAYKRLSLELNWQQQAIMMFGKPIMQPRLHAWYGEKAYRYSGLSLAPQSWAPALLPLKAQCERVADQPFNSVLANLYRHGQDSMGWHQDNEPELGHQPVIASLSLGATRRFALRHIQSKEKLTFELSHGSLLVMAGDTQHCWQHTIPKTRQACQPRINLTFRQII
ncbi:alpha-ketoglutarate-dependent dioxygenase AlkB family protein [Vibrio injensis]|uniref:alpha-ketoglutarate-dependent dioxygenase AlkB family protein n=1 Tax=Vibrio injensis TaxID=1307414 RepID=UPI00093277C1|nr:alpha-ketoglutarate-dependent dioxygenase AlkB [Vibrio injensis]